MKYAGYANMEIIDLKTQSYEYQSDDRWSRFHKLNRFPDQCNSPIIYMAASNALAKLAHGEDDLDQYLNFGENVDRSKGVLGDMTIKDKKYTVLITSRRQTISYFRRCYGEIGKIPGVKSEVPNLGMSSAIINNKFYVFGDDTGTRKCYVFYPNLPEAEQISNRSLICPIRQTRLL